MCAKWVRANAIRRRRARATRAPSSRERRRRATTEADARARELTRARWGASVRAHGREHGGFLARIHG